MYLVSDPHCTLRLTGTVQFHHQALPPASLLDNMCKGEEPEVEVISGIHAQTKLT